MYKLLLVTNKLEIRQLYAGYAGWDAQGFERPTIARTAEEGQRHLSTGRFDVVSCLLPVEQGRAFAHLLSRRADIVGMETVRTEARLREELRGIRRELIAKNAKSQEPSREEARRELRQAFGRTLLSGTVVDDETLRHKLAALDEPEMLNERPVVTVSFRMPDGDMFLTQTWKYGRERLENALRNVFEDGEGAVRYSLLQINPHHMRLLAVPAEPMDVVALYEAALAHMASARKTVAQCFDLSIRLQRVNAYRGLQELAQENADKVAH